MSFNYEGFFGLVLGRLPFMFSTGAVTYYQLTREDEIQSSLPVLLTKIMLFPLSTLPLLLCDDNFIFPTCVLFKRRSPESKTYLPSLLSKARTVNNYPTF